jgi:outer membrane receptor protein involved in Fe transport
VLGQPRTAGYLSYLNGSKAGAVSDRWSYRVSMGLFLQDALARPRGVIPGSPTNQTYPSYANDGTAQPKMDARVDYDFPDGIRSMSFSAGHAGTSGIMHSGIGPFSITQGSTMSYGKWNFHRQGFKAQAFINVLDGKARNLLTVGPTGQPILFNFTTRTTDFEVGDTRLAGRKHVLTYGGNLRLNFFKLTIAPGEDQRTEGGAYLQDEILINDHFRLVAGARVDKFSSIDDPVFSPRVAFLMRPNPDHTFRLSYNRAFRAPSMINNNLQVTIAEPLPLSVIGQPGIFLVPIDAVGNRNLKEAHVDAYELSYTGIILDRTTVTAAVYDTRTENDILFTLQSLWPTSTPPPGWAFGPAVWGLVQSSARFPRSFTYLNLGVERNRGFEFGVDSHLAGGASVYANYSYQRQPRANFPLTETNHAPRHRGNLGVSYSDERWLGALSLSSATSAFWQDVLDARFSGTTEPWTVVNGSIGVKIHGESRDYQAMLKVTNMFNREVQQHIFGDVIKRQIVAELRVSLK